MKSGGNYGHLGRICSHVESWHNTNCLHENLFNKKNR